MQTLTLVISNAAKKRILDTGVSIIDFNRYAGGIWTPERAMLVLVAQALHNEQSELKLDSRDGALFRAIIKPNNVFRTTVSSTIGSAGPMPYTPTRA